MEDAKWDLLARNIRLAGKRMAENENRLTINALDGAANTVSGGAAVTIGNITRAQQYLEDEDFEPMSMFVGNEIMNDLRNIDTFVEADKSGSTEMLDTAFRGIILGMRVFRVYKNAGMTTTSAYVTDKDEAYIIVEKRTITVEGFKLETFDMEGAVVSQRITVGLLKSGAVAKITTS